MKATEKQQLYNLLKTVSSSLYGYDSPDFKDSIPDFQDDIINESQAAASLQQVSSAGCSSGQNSTEAVFSVLVLCDFSEITGSSSGFTQEATQLMEKMLGAIQLYKGKNISVCNCENNVQENTGFNFSEKINQKKPSAILCMGNNAFNGLFSKNEDVKNFHGINSSYKGIPVTGTWHPSTLLSSPEFKRPAWEDLKAFKNILLAINPDYDKQ